MLRVLSVPTPALIVPRVLSRLDQDSDSSDWLIVAMRGALVGGFRRELLLQSGDGVLLGPQVVTIEHLVANLRMLDATPRPLLSLSRAQLRVLTAGLVEEIHRESGGRLFRDRVHADGSAILSTLGPLVTLVEELEPLYNDSENVRRRLTPPEAEGLPSQRAEEVSEFYSRLRTWMRSNRLRGPLGDTLAAAEFARSAPPPFGLHRLLFVGVDGSGVNDVALRVIEGFAENPRIRQLEVAMVLPSSTRGTAWKEYPNKHLWKRWQLEMGAERLKLPARRDDLDSPSPGLRSIRHDPFRMGRSRQRAAAAIRATRVPDTVAEAEWVARTIKSEILKGRLPGEIAVVSRDMDVRAERFQRTLEEYGIPTVASLEIPLSAVPAVQALLSYARVLAGEWTLPLLLSAAESPYVALGADPGVLKSIVSTHNTLSTSDTWLAALARALDALPEDTTDPEGAMSLRTRIGDTISALQDLKCRVDALGGVVLSRTPAEWGAFVRTALAGSLLEERITEGPAELSPELRARIVRVDLDGVNTLLALLDDQVNGHVLGGSDNTPLPLERWMEGVEAAMEDLRMRASSYPRDGVHLLTPTQAAYRSWESVYIVGMAEGITPAPIKTQSFVLSDEERFALSLPTLDERSARERLLFHMAVASARERLTFTAPAADSRGKSLVTSPYLVAMTLHLLGLEIGQVSAQSLLPSSPDLVFRDRDVRLLAARRTREIIDRGDRGQARRDPLVRHWLGSSRGRWVLERWGAEHFRAQLDHGLRTRPEETMSDPRGIFAGIVPPALLPASVRTNSAPFSPSDFKRFEACGFRFMAHRLFRIRGDHLGGEARMLGSIQHEILEALYRELHAKKLLPPGDGRGMDQALQLLKDITTEMVERRIPEPGQALRSLNADLIVAALDGFVRRDLSRLREGQAEASEVLNTSPVALEQWVDAPVSSRGVKFRIRGIMDRVEVVQDSRIPSDLQGTLVLLDYKTRASKSASTPARDLGLQLPLYAIAASRHNQKGVLGVGEIRTMNAEDPPALMDGRFSVAPSGAGIVWEPTEGGSRLSTVTRTALARAAGMVASIRSGDMAPGSNRNCWGCDLARVCRAAKGSAGGGMLPRSRLPVVATRAQINQARKQAKSTETSP